MIFVPLPFVVALLLLILLVRMLRTEEWNAPGRRLFLALIAAYALQSVLIGFRWGYDTLAIMPFQAVLAALVAPLSFASFADLTLETPRPLKRQWPHLLPAIGVALSFAFWRDIVGLSLILIFLGYGLSLLWISRSGADGLVASRLDGAFLSHRSLMVTAVALIASALSDVFISLDFDNTGGAHAGRIVALGNVIVLLILGSAAAAAGTSQPEQPATEAAPPPPSQPTEEDGAVAAHLDSLMETRQIYRDPELNLNRIARKLGLPARSVSTAVNRIRGMSVSQYVNEFRIRFACDQLLRTELPVTSVMFEAGFISKSNFNREFLRVTGASPTEYRRREQAGTVASPSRAPAFVSP
jgi:AraC-like DNA-binding protein